MDLFQVTALLITLAAAFNDLDYRHFEVPMTKPPVSSPEGEAA